VRITLGDESVEVGVKEYTPWLVAKFDGVQGIVRFYVQAWDGDDFELYATPVNIDPNEPAMPISHPFVYSIYLAKSLGPFATLGLAEDTWALNERGDRRGSVLEAGLAVLRGAQEAVVGRARQDAQRICHRRLRHQRPHQPHVLRTLDASHPANEGKEFERWRGVIPDTYAKMDALVGELRAKIADDPSTLLMVISDHGFTDFRRCVNLNTWLHQNGYLVLEPGHDTSGDWFAHVDWSKTKAFTLGLTGMFVNRKGREKHGIVGPEDVRRCVTKSRRSSKRCRSEVRHARHPRSVPHARNPRRSLRRRGARDPDRVREGLPQLVGVRDRRRHARSLHRQQEELVRRPLRRSAARARRVLLQSQDRDG
jgi:hypothetical protein